MEPCDHAEELGSYQTEQNINETRVLVEELLETVASILDEALLEDSVVE